MREDDPRTVAVSHAPIYLHFLDRELGQSVNFALTTESLEHILKTLLLGTSSPLYCGISLIWENTSIGDDARLLLSDLVRAQALLPVSYNANVDEFIESRQRLYQHDASRYPLYFTEKVGLLRQISPAIYKGDDTTDHLEGYLGGWASSRQRAGGSETEDLARKVTLQALSARDRQALTYSYFSTFVHMVDQNRPAEWRIRKAISLGYTNHYLEYGAGDIATGIPGLALYDVALARHFPLGDVSILADLIEIVGLGRMLATPWRALQQEWHGTLEGRGWGVHGRLAGHIRTAIYAVATVASANIANPTQFAVRSLTRAVLRRLAGHTAFHMPYSSRPDQWLHAAELNAESLNAMLGRRPQYTRAVEHGRRLYLEERTDVLVLTATLVETRAVIEAASLAWNAKPSPHHIGDKTYWDLGWVAGARVRLVQTEMGSGGPAGSMLTASDAVSVLNPGAMVMVGIAFGVNPDRQKIGEILVSRQLLAYELQRVSSLQGRPRLTPRGDRVSASPRLLDRFRAAAVTWRKCGLQFGLLVSGEKLVDNLEFRDALVALAGGEIDGGEMEGAGLFAVAHRHKVDWIVVKSICDWADGAKSIDKEARQLLAATNAAGFLAHTLRQGGFASPR